MGKKLCANQFCR